MANESTSGTKQDKQLRRKTGVVRLTFKSESVFLFMRKSAGDNLNNAMYRIGELFKMTSRSHDKKLYTELCNWFDNEVIASAKVDIENLKNQLKALQEETDSELTFLNVKNPDMTIDVEIIHKSHGAIFNILNQVDFLMDDIETLILSGIDDDEDIEDSSRAKMNLIINNISRKIFTVTKPGKRDGGPFNSLFFIQQLQKGVFSLYPKKETVQEDTPTKIENKEDDEIMSGANEDNLSDASKKPDNEELTINVAEAV